MLQIPFKERFAEHLADPPIEFNENLEVLRTLIVFGDVPAPASDKGMIEVEIARIIKNMETLHGEDGVVLPRETQLQLCLEIAVSACAAISIKETIPTLIGVMDKLLAAKNHDYGFAFAKWGSWGVIIRMWDKVLRAISVLDMTADSPWVNESLVDTFKDLAGYSILLYTVLRDEQIKFVRGYA